MRTRTVGRASPILRCGERSAGGRRDYDDDDGVYNDGCPALYGDVDPVHAELLGTYESFSNTYELEGCIEDVDGYSPLGNVYLKMSLDAFSNEGTIDVWTYQPWYECIAGNTVGSPIPAFVAATTLATAPDESDYDGDRCPDRRELTDTQAAGGLRDPFNPWDYFEATNYVGAPNLNERGRRHVNVHGAGQERQAGGELD